jgi:23S rRNA (uracil1939-C5)-methyltransferase
MLIKNQVYETVICDYTAEGQGVAKIEGCAVFIPNAIRGERVLVRIEKAQKTWATGKITQILEKSPHRVNRECPVAKLCGGCDFWHMDYEEECALKADRVRDCLNRLGGEELETVPILSAPSCHGYRNKAQYPVTSRKGKAYAGFFKAGTHQVIENDRCLILPPEMDRVKELVIDHMNRFKISAYDEENHKGLVRHIFVRRGAVSHQVLVCLCVNGKALPHARELAEALKAVPGFASLVLSVNQKPGNTILGDEFITLYGPGYIEDTLCGLTFRLSPRSFYQVNHHRAQRLYETAIREAGITKEDTVLDLYCGVGTITLAMASAAGKVIGVEVVPQAVEDAKENALRNGITNAEFICGDAGQAALELESRGVRADVVVVDPPRKGLNADAIEALARFGTKRIVYVSCDPATLGRDVALLKEKGYRLSSVTAADLFPRCAHVESVVCLSRKTTHEMKLHTSPFEMIKSGTKNIELRLYDEKRQKIKAGDDIIFTNTDTGEKVCATVKKLHLFASFEELYKTLTLLQCGYTAENIDTAHPSDMTQYYSVEEQQKYGVVGIELSFQQ